MSDFLPLSYREAQERGWDELDFICVTGDAYVDHPSFGITITARVLEAAGFRVAMLAQPEVTGDRGFLSYPKPKYGFFITSGNIDSMVSNYTAAKKHRSDDAYSPGGKGGRRPDRAVIVYCNLVRKLYPDIPIVIGGLEASLRRFAHYDYWDDAVRPSILTDTSADLLIFGMGEKQTVQIARRLAAGEPVSQIKDIRGTCWLSDGVDLPQNAVSCASFTKVAQDKLTHAKAAKAQIEEQDSVYGRAVIQKHGERFLVQNPPMEPLNQEELDAVFELPYQRMWHPSYASQGGVPAIEEVEFSIMHNRGCFGNCNFCSIAFHQGRQVTCRSQESVVREAERFLENPRFKGYIHDVGGPTANFRRPSCDKQRTHGLCKDRKCLAPRPCPAMKPDHSDYVELLRRLRAIKGVKKVFVRSGVRFDYVMADPDRTFLTELVTHHVSGQLKVAPEHCSARVLEQMGKPSIEVYERFAKQFYDLSKKAGKEQYLVPYLMSSHPGSTMKEAIDLAVFLKKSNMRPEQVQDFYPTPGTPSTCMFYTGYDPLTLKPVYTPKTPEEKAAQRALLQYFKPENRRTIITALIKAGREDLIGNAKTCLVQPDREYQEYKASRTERPGSRYSKHPRPNREKGGRPGKTTTRR